MHFLRRTSEAQWPESPLLTARRGIEAAVLISVLLGSFVFVDHAVVSWVRELHEARSLLSFVLEGVNPVIAFLGHGATLITGSVVLCVGGRFLNRKAYSLGKTLLVSLLSAGVTVQLVKHLVGRARPRITDMPLFMGPSFRSGYDSFPSGHTTLAFAFACVLSGYFPSYRVLFYSFAVAVGFERVGDLAHFPSDVFAGAVVGMIVARIVSVKMLKVQEVAVCRKENSKNRDSQGVMRSDALKKTAQQKR
jgi:undecaprenyl-diphosphatase